MKFTVLAVLLAVGSASAFSVRAPRALPSRGVMTANAEPACDRRTGFAFLAGLVLAAPQANAALQPCPAGANNCRSTASTDQNSLPLWKSGKQQAEAVADIAATISSYPQTGQNGVDGGGWRLVAGDDTSDYFRVEYTSKRFKFVDDLEIQVQDGNASVRSSSRVGDSDFGVNTSRVKWFANELIKKGWSAQV